jgi:hypothetical protein
MMEAILRLLSYIVIGTILLLLNVLYVRTLVESFKPNAQEYIILPIKLIGLENNKDGTAGTVLAQMLQARLNAIEHSLTADQQELSTSKSTVPAPSPPSAANAPLAPDLAITLFLPKALSFEPITLQKQVGLLQEAKTIDVKVAGVEVAGFVAWIQNLLVQRRTLSFAIDFIDKNKMIVTGDVSPLAPKDDGAIWFECEGSHDTAISKLAYAVLAKHIAASNKTQTDVSLTSDDLNMVADGLHLAVALNRKIAVGSQVRDEDYEEVFQKLGPVALGVLGWPKLKYFAANVAEDASHNEAAIRLYTEFGKTAATDTSLQTLVIKATNEIPLLENIPKTLQDLRLGIKSVPDTPETQEARKRTESDIKTACLKYDEWITGIPRPGLQLITSKSPISLYLTETNKIYTPLTTQYIPDWAHRESAHAYVFGKLKFDTTDMVSATIESSYADIFAAWLKQKALGQTATEFNWLLYEGAVAWESKGDPKKDRRPLISFKKPGTAFSDDRQVGFYSKAAEDGSDPWQYSGIPNHAFYETAIQLDTDQAFKIWLDALDRMQERVTFAALAAATQEAAGKYGRSERDAVAKAWSIVGL